MTFVFPILLGGLLAAGVPVLLHLLVRQRPRRLPFPAFRFLAQKQKVSARKLRLRHLLLLALRMLLIAGLCLALARPRLFYEGLGLSGERPVAAVFLFDTSASMEYRTGEANRLDEAKKRALELLDRLPAEGGRFLVLDSADALHPSTVDPWLTSADAARKRIAQLKVRPANAAVTRSLERAYRRLAELSRSRDDADGQKLMRLLCVFSDRTRACWDSGAVAALDEAADQVPPLFEGLVQARARLPRLKQLVGALPGSLAADGKEYNSGPLLGALDTLQSELRGLIPADLPPSAELSRAVQQTRQSARALLEQTAREDAATEDSAKEDRARLRGALHELLRDLGGVQTLFLDVGVEQPVDLALVALELPRTHAEGAMQQSFAEGEMVRVQAVVRAVGKDLKNTLLCEVGGTTSQQPVDLRAGQDVTLPFEIDTRALKLGPGTHAALVRFETATDALSFNNRRHLTFAVRARQRVLVLADETKRAELVARALNVLGYAADLRAVKDAPPLAGYEAVYLAGLAAPSDSLWETLAAFVRQGGGVAVVPPGDETNRAAYNGVAAQKLLPATLAEKVAAPDPARGSSWDWDQASIYEHPLLRPFREWRKRDYDFFVYPRGAFFYWHVQPNERGAVLVRYDDGKRRPALLERPPGNGSAGKVLLFTTPLDRRTPEWNNYAEQITSFYLALIRQSARALCEATETRDLNFVLGRDEPSVALPAGVRSPSYTLAGGEAVEKVQAGDKSVLTFRELREPGNYVLEGRDLEGKRTRIVGGFSVDIPAAESDLTRVPEAEIERVFGPESVVTFERGAGIVAALRGHWSEPAELFPWIMLALLVALALENLLSNRFYRRQSTEPTS